MNINLLMTMEFIIVVEIDCSPLIVRVWTSVGGFLVHVLRDRINLRF